jgi:drug/metabolite transporter (DMT)-like permease
MSPLALGLVLVAALLHAVWNVAAKQAGGDGRFVLLVALLIVGLWAPLGVWAGWDAVPLWGAREWALVGASGLAHLVYFLTLLRGYRVADLSVVYPVARGTGPLLSSLVAVAVLGERLSALSALGVAAVCGGVFLVAGGPALLRNIGRDEAAHARVRRGVAWGGATGVLIALYTVIDGYSVKVALISPILIDDFGNLLRIPFSLPAALADRAATLAAWRRQWRAALLVAAISPLAYILVLYAVRMAPLSHVAPAREVSMLFAAALGGRLLGEGDRRLRFAGAGCIAAGVVALAGA